MQINDVANIAHAINRRNGWWEDEDRNIGELLMLIVTEVAEAMEDWREHRMDTTIRPEDQKPEGFPSEIADIVIRCMDLAVHLGIDLDWEITTKLAFNETRPHRHGGKRA